MKNIGKMIKQAQELQGKMGEMQEKLANLEMEGEAGGGLVKVVLSGKMEMRKVTIDPSLVRPEEASVLEDLIVVAANDAKQKIETKISDKVSELTGGMPLPPGLGLPF
jgi:nucleoid-associated protein EbfC